jgi:hypothetical protein
MNRIFGRASATFSYPKCGTLSANADRSGPSRYGRERRPAAFERSVIILWGGPHDIAPSGHPVAQTPQPRHALAAKARPPRPPDGAADVATIRAFAAGASTSHNVRAPKGHRLGQRPHSVHCSADTAAMYRRRGQMSERPSQSPKCSRFPPGDREHARRWPQPPLGMEGQDHGLARRWPPSGSSTVARRIGARRYASR